MKTIVTKAEYAALKAREPGSVSNWIRGGKISARALVGTGVLRPHLGRAGGSLIYCSILTQHSRMPRRTQSRDRSGDVRSTPKSGHLQHTSPCPLSANMHRSK